MKFYPIHTHYIPSSLDDIELAGAIVCVELTPKYLYHYYGWNFSKSWPTQSIMEFLLNWEDLNKERKSLPFRPYFSLEGGEDLFVTEDLPKLRSKGLISIQIFREKRNSPFMTLREGLTDLGMELLEKMAIYDIFLDVSHLHGPMIKHILNAAPGRKMVSHVVCKDLFPWSLTHRANSMSENELVECDAELYGVPFVDDLVSPAPSRKISERGAIIGNVAEQLVKLASIVGTERVALGPDYFDFSALESEGIEVETVPGLDRCEGLTCLWSELCSRGLSYEDVNNIFWRNAFRVLPPQIKNLP